MPTLKLTEKLPMTIIVYILAVVGCNVMFAALEPWQVFGQVVPL